MANPPQADASPIATPSVRRRGAIALTRSMMETSFEWTSPVFVDTQRACCETFSKASSYLSH